jgi:hypothetical protein
MLNGTAGKSSFSRTVIIGSTDTISAPSPQKKGQKDYTFASWSDGGAQAHAIVAPATATTYTARFRQAWRTTGSMSHGSFGIKTYLTFC